MGDFKDKIVLITGAGRGIGRAIAQAFAARGAAVAANDINPTSLDETVTGIQSAGGRAKAYIFDAAKRMPVAGMVSQVLEGLEGRHPRAYGLPFLGDNNFLLDRFEPALDPEPAYWFEMIGEGKDGPLEHMTRLTISVDRADLSQTRSALFAPLEHKTIEPPIEAWVEVGYS